MLRRDCLIRCDFRNWFRLFPPTISSHQVVLCKNVIPKRFKSSFTKNVQELDFLCGRPICFIQRAPSGMHLIYVYDFRQPGYDLDICISRNLHTNWKSKLEVTHLQ
ncbi:hypothetical protein M413DRAFT_122507 [Hebeloma cylindrosporum]|uniref:Uncharacterized protein n=1 Tax=Hebeloma cylindrosporum TaxID=76867 RepID=A0A0C2XYN3_HEBCY|nr:hypothetical protein M413DRAFT_122507 [Hebeloma cylindrosporum h7]